MNQFALACKPEHLPFWLHIAASWVLGPLRLILEGQFGVNLGSIWGPSSIHLGVHAWGSVRRPFLLLFTELGGCQGRFAKAWRA